jgi:predicted transcriptional regulator
MTNSEKNKNIARRKAISSREAIAAANRQIWQREFNPDYDQVVLRISNAVFAGLQNGAPPPPVG